MDGYSGGYGYLASGFSSSSTDGQNENNTVDQAQINLPYTQPLNLPVDPDTIQTYPHLRQSVGHEFQNPLSPHSAQHCGLPRFPLTFPQMAGIPGLQNVELLQQFLEMQQLSPSGRQQSTGIGNFGSVMNNYLQPTHPIVSHSVANAFGNVQLTSAPKSPVDLESSPSVSPARTSPDFYGYSQPSTSIATTSVIETNLVSAGHSKISMPLPSISNAYPLQVPYPFKLKVETCHEYNPQALFSDRQSVHLNNTIHQDLSISSKLTGPGVDRKLNIGENFEKVCQDSISETDQIADTCFINVVKSDVQNEAIKTELEKRSITDDVDNFKIRTESKSGTEDRASGVKFICLGRLSHCSKIPQKGVREILTEPVDCEERVFTDIILNLPVTKGDWELMQKSKMTAENNLVLNNMHNEQIESPKFPEGTTDEEKASDNEIEDDNFDEDEMYASSAKQELNDYPVDNSHVENLNFDGLGIQDNWYSAAMTKYAELNSDETESPPDVMSPKKGGRSDPDNPFAITSPSFSESAARALVVTTNSSDATLVMVSIMSIGTRKKLLTKLVDSEAAQGGIVSVINPVETASTESKENNSESNLKTETTSIMSKLNREKKDKDEEVDNSIDRLDISIKIDDDQFIAHGEQKRWQCKLCTKSYTTKHNLVAHILDHCSIKPHLCLVCGKYFKQLSHLNTHMLTHDHVKPHICNVCNKGFTQISHLKRHQAVHYDSKPYICDICSRGFAYPSELRNHKEKHIPGKDKCVDCGAEFTSQKDLREHMDTHEHRMDLTCQHCERVFRFPSQLRDHLMSHEGARPFICTECGMDFMKEHHLKAHQFTHTGLRPYACPHCSRSFNQKANMVRHMLIHNAQRAFKCEVCTKTFTQPQTLKAHMVVHSDKKPYSCKFCGKQFGRLHNLQGHLHIHNNSKPYVCSICGSSFTLKGNLNRHKKVKHGLSESMENMEEDAVNFLGNLSDRIRDNDSSYEDLDTSRDDSLVSDGKSPKKGRKSIPRKRVNIPSEEGSDKMFDNDEEVENASDDELDSERVNELTYSEEERENEQRIDEEKSKYFNNNEKELKKKRKHGLSLKDDGSTRVNTTFDKTDSVESVGLSLKDDGSTRINATFDQTDSVGDGVDEDACAEYDEDTENELDESETLELKDIEKKDDIVSKEKRSTRKRKIKCLAEDFVGDNFDDNEGWSPQPTKVRRKKGAKLDSLIASKFKSV